MCGYRRKFGKCGYFENLKVNSAESPEIIVMLSYLPSYVFFFCRYYQLGFYVLQL